ncbi:MAG: GNAT superfamily N-acetyltransferase [Gammaproteobacteria bacterium]|jgi:GNAT superfamily N-acetyltransferase
MQASRYMKVRIARSDDFPRLLTLRCALWPSVELQNHELMLHRRADNAARCATMILENDHKEICGFAHVTREMALAVEATRVQLDAVFVTPPMRRKGGARQLLDAVQRWAHCRGASRLFWDLPLEDEQAWEMLQLLGFDDRERRIRTTLAVSVPMEVETPRAEEALHRADGDAPTPNLACAPDDEIEFVQMERACSPIALIVNTVLFVCAVFSFVNSNTYSQDMLSGMLLAVAFVLSFSLLFVAMRYRKRRFQRTCRSMVQRTSEQPGAGYHSYSLLPHLKLTRSRRNAQVRAALLPSIATLHWGIFRRNPEG